MRHRGIWSAHPGSRERSHRRPAAILGALALTLAVAACSGGHGHTTGVVSLNGGAQPATSTTAGGDGDELRLAVSFARCMRQHGIDVPDPRMTADGIDQPLPNGVDGDDPRLTAAERACGMSLPSDKLTPRGG
jgi:hypothetical protein